MSELRGRPDEPDGGDHPERSGPATAGSDIGAARQRIEPRSRTEYVVGLERQTLTRTELPFQPGRDALQRFEPRRAGLPEVSLADGAAHLDKHHAERPWLAAARDCSPEVQRVFTALDQGGGHGHIRHEGWVTEEMNERRLRCLEDPAQLDPAKRAAGIDGLAAGNQQHRCGSIATRITSPEVFAEAVARGVEHPDVRGALGAEFRDKQVPYPVVLPIAEVLGADGHRFCTGWQLEPIGGSMKAARHYRDAWAAAQDQDTRQPATRSVETFDGGTMTFMFGPNRARDGYEIVTMYVNPPDS